MRRLPVKISAKRIKEMKKLVLCTVSALVLAGCANDGSVYRSDVYSTAQVNQAQEVKVVRIISVMPAPAGTMG